MEDRIAIDVRGPKRPIGDEAMGKAARSARHDVHQIDATQCHRRPVNKRKARRQ